MFNKKLFHLNSTYMLPYNGVNFLFIVCRQLNHYILQIINVLATIEIIKLEVLKNRI